MIFTNTAWFTSRFWAAGLATLYVLCWWFIAFLYLSLYLDMTGDSNKQKILNVVHYVTCLVTLVWYFLGYLFINAYVDRLFYDFQIYGYPILCVAALLLVGSKGTSGFLDEKKLKLQYLLLGAFCLC